MFLQQRNDIKHILGQVGLDCWEAEFGSSKEISEYLMVECKQRCDHIKLDKEVNPRKCLDYLSFLNDPLALVCFANTVRGITPTHFFLKDQRTSVSFKVCSQIFVSWVNF